MDAKPPAILHEILRARGLSVTVRKNGTIAVGNPLHPRIAAVIATADNRYLTDYGYELGEWVTSRRLLIVPSWPPRVLSE